jgi:hypothetical protein
VIASVLQKAIVSNNQMSNLLRKPTDFKKTKVKNPGFRRDSISANLLICSLLKFTRLEWLEILSSVSFFQCSTPEKRSRYIE